MPPEHLLKESLLIALYSERSERAFCERLSYGVLVHWFLDLNSRGGPFDQWTFAESRSRLLEHGVTGRFFGGVVQEARRQRLLSEDHFSVDRILLEAWVSLKALGSGTRSGSRRENQAGGDPTQRMYRRRAQRRCRYASERGSGEAVLPGHVLVENRHGLVVGVVLSQATGTAETGTALTTPERAPTARRITVGAD